MNPQAIKIYEILKDGEWHCPISWGYADGHTKRITDISRFIAPTRTIKSEWCDCGRHTSKVMKRKIVNQTPVPVIVNPIAEAFLTRWKKEEIKQANLF